MLDLLKGQLESFSLVLKQLGAFLSLFLSSCLTSFIILTVSHLQITWNQPAHHSVQVTDI